MARRLGTTTGDVLTSVGLLPRGPSRPVDGLPGHPARCGPGGGPRPVRRHHGEGGVRHDPGSLRPAGPRGRPPAASGPGEASVQTGPRLPLLACLAEGGGRRLLSWRLGWSLACAEHRLPLDDACPQCNRTLRHFPTTVRHPLTPGRCHSPLEDDSHRTARCGQPFEADTALACLACPADSPIGPGGTACPAALVKPAVFEAADAPSVGHVGESPGVGRLGLARRVESAPTRLACRPQLRRRKHAGESAAPPLHFKAPGDIP